jgi:hypothetical protein
MPGGSKFGEQLVRLYRMKRLLLSVLGGFGIPFFYVVIAGPLFPYTEDERISYLLWIPVGWPKILYFYVSRPFSNRALNLEDDVLFVMMIVCNIILYGSLTDSLLLLRSFTMVNAHTKPPLPIFRQDDSGRQDEKRV